MSSEPEVRAVYCSVTLVCGASLARRRLRCGVATRLGSRVRSQGGRCCTSEGRQTAALLPRATHGRARDWVVQGCCAPCSIEGSAARKEGPCGPSKWRGDSRRELAIVVAAVGAGVIRVGRQQHDAAVERKCPQLDVEAGPVLVREGRAEPPFGSGPRKLGRSRGSADIQSAVDGTALTQFLPGQDIAMCVPCEWSFRKESGRAPGRRPRAAELRPRPVLQGGKSRSKEEGPCGPSKWRDDSRRELAILVAAVGAGVVRVGRQQHDAAVERKCPQLDVEARSVLVREGRADAASSSCLSCRCRRRIPRRCKRRAGWRDCGSGWSCRISFRD